MISGILILIASLSKAVVDASAHGYLNGFWNEQQAWKNKWKNGDQTQGERFLGSSTVFVFLTSGWHLSQFVFLNSMFTALVVYTPLLGRMWDFIVYSIVFRVIFEITYRALRR